MDHCDICGQPIQNEGHACLKDVPASTAALNDPKIGMVVGRHYEILSRVGEGGMSVVYKAKHQLLNKIVAIKVLKPVLAVDQIKLARFQQEAMSVYRLDHPNIIRVYHFEMPKHEPFLVMDYLDGKPLSEIIAADGRLPLDRCVSIFRQVCSGMQHAHESGVIHRDIKPSNIIVSTDENGQDAIKIVDFGIAKVSDWEIVGGIQGVTQEGEVFGSPLYMSPEQCTAKHMDNRSDIYSAACVMYECLTGEPPMLGATASDTMQMHVFDAVDNVSTHVPDLPNASQVDAVMFKALAKHPDRRYQTMAEFEKDLETLVEKKPPVEKKPLVPIAEEAKPQSEYHPKNPKKKSQQSKQPHLHPVSIGLITLSTIVFVVSATLIYQYFFAPTQVKDWQQANVTAQQLFDQGKLGEAQNLFEKALQLASKEERNKRVGRTVASLESLLDVARCQGKDPEKYAEQLKQTKLDSEPHDQIADTLAQLKKYTDTADSAYRQPAKTPAVAKPELDNDTPAKTVPDKAVPPNSVPNKAAAPKSIPDQPSSNIPASDKAGNISATPGPTDVDRLCQRADDEAVSAMQQSDFDTAGKLLQAALLAAKKLAPDSVSVALSLHNLGCLSLAQNKPTEAMQFFQESKDLADKLGDKMITAANMLAMADTYLKTGEYVKAKEATMKAITIYRSTSGAASRDAAQCHLRLGNIAMDQGNYSEAESEFNQAFEVTQKLPADQKTARDLIEYRQSLARLYSNHEMDPVKSRTLLTQTIAEQEALENKSSADWNALGESLTDLADLDVSTQNSKESLPLCERAISIAQRIGPSNNSLYARALLVKAKAQWSQHSPSAQQTISAALKVYADRYTDKSSEVAQAHLELGQMYLREKNFPQAEEELKQSLDALSKTNPGQSAIKRKDALELLRQVYAAQKKDAQEAEIRKQQQQQ